MVAEAFWELKSTRDVMECITEVGPQEGGFQRKRQLSLDMMCEKESQDGPSLRVHRVYCRGKQ